MENKGDERNLVSGQPVLIAYPPCQDDEISLVDICRVLWQGKKIIAGTFVFCVLLAVIMVFILPEIYKTEVVLRPPLFGDIIGLQVLDAHRPGPDKVHEFGPDKVHHKFMVNLKSTGLRYQFFKENRVAEQLSNRTDLAFDDYAAFERIFNQQIDILALNKGEGIIFTNLSFTGEDRDVIGNILDKYVDFVDSYTVYSLLDEIDAKVNLRKTMLQERIKKLRLAGLKELEDKSIRFREALTLAIRLNIADPIDFFGYEDGQQSGIQGTELSLPLYARGYKALQAELAQMEKRENHDAFIPSIRTLQAELNILEEKEIERENIRSVMVAQDVRIIDKPIKPRRNLIIIMGGVAGLMLGVFAVFARRFIAEVTCSGNAGNVN